MKSCCMWYVTLHRAASNTCTGLWGLLDIGSHVIRLSDKLLTALQVCPLEGCGVQLRVQGFSHKLPLLTRYITRQLATLTAQVGSPTHTAQQPCLTL